MPDIYGYVDGRVCECVCRVCVNMWSPRDTHIKTNDDDLLVRIITLRSISQRSDKLQRAMLVVVSNWHYTPIYIHINT